MIAEYYASVGGGEVNAQSPSCGREPRRDDPGTQELGMMAGDDRQAGVAHLAQTIG